MLPYNTSSAASSWNGGGILRKPGGTTTTTTHNIVPRQELLVFGYACKVFRDDAKAREIDQGKHLIPWMGDPNLKIDRYDVRGALSDLAPFEPPPGGYGNRLDYLTAEEQRAEQLCEEERYFFLYNNEEEHILQQEEDLKRLQQETSGSSSYGRVGFQYDTVNGSTHHGPPSMNDDEQRNSLMIGPEDAEQPYVMPKSLQVPISIQMPDTMKQHAIIEKTARFIATQGTQMEILLKAKQSNNTQFEFLAQNGILNPYYKYVLNAIKSGSYPPEITSNETDTTLTNEERTQNEQSTEHQKPIKTVPTIKYTPSANCAYTQLISKIKGVPLPEFLNENASSAAATTTATTSESPTPTPILLQYEHTYVQADDDNNSNSNTQGYQEAQVELLQNSSALALAQNYSSDSETDEEEESKKQSKPEPILNFPIPAENLKNIIDKTATYVIKNGRQFEETLRTKSEDRFTFLIPENEFYPYYLYKITGDPDAASKEQKARKAAAVAAALLSKKGLAPVSFSIKTNDQAALPPALPQEPSDDDDDDDEQTKKSNGSATANQTRNVPEHVQRAIALVETQLMARNAQLAAAAAAAAAKTNSSSINSTSDPIRNRFDMDYSSGSSKNLIKSTKTEMERNAIFEQQQQNRQKELKKAEEKVKDKLTQIAREKLGGLISKDKQLQLERKRKAMAFLNQIKGSNQDDGALSYNPDTKTIGHEDGNGNASDSSEASVHSIPITSYGPDDDDDQEPQKDSQKSRHKEEKLPADTAPTVLLSDDDDDEVQLISEHKGDPPSLYSRKIHRNDLKRGHNSRLDSRELERRKKHKYSSESDDYTSSSEDLSSEKHKHERHKSQHKKYSTEKSKKSKKSSSSKKKKKHKSRSARDRSSSTYSQHSRTSRHSQHSRHNSRYRSPSSESLSDSDSDESTTTTESQRYRLQFYELDDQGSYASPPSHRKSSSSLKTHKSSSRHKERKHSRYDD